MADKLLDLEGLTYYDQKIKNYIDTADENVTSDLTDKLDAETQARTQADTQLQTNITNEASARQSADTALGNRIDDVVDGTTSVGKLTNPLQFGVEGSLDSYNGSVAGKKITKAVLGLGNVDNTADINKPVSTAQQSAINDAKSELLGDAGTNYNTLGKLEDAIQAEVTRAGQAEDAIDEDLQEFKTTTNQNITQIEQDLASEGERITALDNNVVKKTGQSSQAIQGNIQIQGDLTVNGTTTSEDHQTLLVQDNIIVTNSDGVAISGLSGMAIRINSTSAFGIVYDPSVQELKAGLGTLSAENEFTFSSGEGYPITLRDSDGDLVDGNVVMWDNVGKRLTDSGIVANLIALQNGTYSGMTVGKATADGQGRNIVDTYATNAKVDEIPDLPVPTTSENGKILSVENGNYTLVDTSTITDTTNFVKKTGETTQTIEGGITVTQGISTQNALIVTATSSQTAMIGLADGIFGMALMDVGSGSAVILMPDGIIHQSSSGGSASSLAFPEGKDGTFILNTDIATTTSAGVVKPETKTSTMTQAVGVDSSGKLWTEPGGANLVDLGTIGSLTVTLTSEQLQQIQDPNCIGVKYNNPDNMAVVMYKYTQTGSNLFNSMVMSDSSINIIMCHAGSISGTTLTIQEFAVQIPSATTYATDEEINALFTATQVEVPTITTETNSAGGTTYNIDWGGGNRAVTSGGAIFDVSQYVTSSWNSGTMTANVQVSRIPPEIINQCLDAANNGNLPVLKVSKEIINQDIESMGKMTVSTDLYLYVFFNSMSASVNTGGTEMPVLSDDIKFVVAWYKPTTLTGTNDALQITYPVISNLDGEVQYYTIPLGDFSINLD